MWRAESLVGITRSIEVLGGGEGYSFHKFMRYGDFLFLLKCVFVWLLAEWRALDSELLPSQSSQAVACLREGRGSEDSPGGDFSHRVEVVAPGNSWAMASRCLPAVMLRQNHLGSFGT